MPRTLAAVAFFVIASLATPSIGAAQQPRTLVINYECEQAEAETNGAISCSTEGGFSFHWGARSQEIEGEEKRRAYYYFNALALRFFQLGGRTFEVTADYWDEGERHSCTVTPSGVGYSCSKCVEIGDGAFEC